MKLLVILNFTLSLVCFFHICTILYNYLNPENPSVKYYDKNLSELDFPLNFKICFERPDQIEIFKEMGYKNNLIYYDFYYGKSRFNRSLYGWEGHSSNGTVGPVKGVCTELLILFLIFACE